MGVCVHYWAIPTQSRLYTRVQEDPAFYLLMMRLFNEGNGLYFLRETYEDQETESILETLLPEDLSILGSEPEAHRRIAEFLDEVDRTRAEHPGIEQRGAMLEKTDHVIAQKLGEVLLPSRPDAYQWADQLMGGDGQLTPPSALRDEEPLRLVSTALVREGAATLESITPERLFPGGTDWDEWCMESYDELRAAFLEAAKHSEVLVIGVG